MFTVGIEPKQEGVEDEDEDADIDVKDVEHDVAFFKELELEEFGGESDRILFVFRQDVKVVNVCDVVLFSSFDDGEEVIRFVLSLGLSLFICISDLSLSVFSKFSLLISVDPADLGVTLSFVATVLDAVFTILVVEVMVAGFTSGSFSTLLPIRSAEDASANSFFARSETFCSVGTSSTVKDEDSVGLFNDVVLLRVALCVELLLFSGTDSD